MRAADDVENLSLAYASFVSIPNYPRLKPGAIHEDAPESSRSLGAVLVVAHRLPDNQQLNYEGDSGN